MSKRGFRPGKATRLGLANPRMSEEARRVLANEYERGLGTAAGGKPKMHPAHTVTDKEIEIRTVSAATRNPDGSRRTN